MPPRSESTPQTPYGMPVGQSRPFANESKPGMTPEVMAELVIDFFRRRGILACLVGSILATITSLAVLNVLPLSYKASADIVLVPPESTSPEHYRLTQWGLISSNAVLNSALNDPAAKSIRWVTDNPQPANILSGMLKQDPFANGNVLRYSVESTDPEETHILANAVLDAYLELLKTQATKTSEDLKANNRKDTLKLQTRQEELRAQIREGLKNIGIEGDNLKDPILALTKRIEERERELTMEESAVARLEGRKRIAADRVKNYTPDATVMLQIQQNPQLVEMQQNLQRVSTQIRSLKSTVLNDDPQLASLQQIETKLRRNIAAQQSLLEGSLLDKGKDKLEQELADVEHELEAAKKLRDRIKKDIADFTSKKDALERTKSQLGPLDDELSNIKNQLLAQDAALQREIANVNLRANSSALTRAKKPAQPSLSSKRLIMGLGSAAVMFGATLLGFWLLDVRQRFVSRPEHVQAFVGVPVLAKLPAIPRGHRLPSDEDYQTNSPNRRSFQMMYESINALRIMLMFAPDRHGDGISSLMVTSARDGEGKSTLCAYLGLCLARAGVKVLLVEADLYRPAQSAMFKIPRSPGLSDVLLGKYRVMDVIRETDYQGLFILPSGEGLDNPEEHLSPERLTPIFNELKAAFSAIVVDSPPILPVFDAMIFSKLVDETILAAMCEHSQVYPMKQTVDRLRKIGIEPLGVVVNNCRIDQRYGYMYYYDYRNYAYKRGPLTPTRQSAPHDPSYPNGYGNMPNGLPENGSPNNGVNGQGLPNNGSTPTKGTPNAAPYNPLTGQPPGYPS